MPVSAKRPSGTKLAAMRESLGSWQAVADELQVPRSTLQGWRRDAQLVREDRSVSSDDPREWGDIARLVESRNLDPADWEVARARVNTWGADGNTHSQLRVDLVPVSQLLRPARCDGWVPPPPPKRRAVPGAPELVCFLGDHHAPHFDRALHEATLVWLRAHKPDRIVLLGDLIDADSVSRHRFSPEWATSLQENLDCAYRIIAEYRRASPGSTVQLLPGNHDDRVRLAVIDNLRPALNLKRACSPDELSVLSLPYLLRLDELGVEWVESPNGMYETAQVEVSPTLAARHGWIASRGSGSSALKTLQRLMYSVVIGHTHRQSIVKATMPAIDGTPRVFSACEAGTMARVDGGLGYANAADWQQGFATAHVFGRNFSLQLAQWSAPTLFWGGWSHTVD